MIHYPIKALLLCFLLIMPICFADGSISCHSLFLKQKQISAVYTYDQLNQKFDDEGVQVEILESSHWIPFSLEQKINHQTQIKKAIESAPLSIGLFGQWESIGLDSQLKPEVHTDLNERERFKSEYLQKRRLIPPIKEVSEISQVVKVTSLTEDVVLVQYTLFSQPTELLQAIQSRFGLLHHQMAVRAYRKSNLINPNPRSGYQLYDNFVSNFDNGIIFSEGFLLFHRDMWEAQVQALSSLIKEYHEAPDVSHEPHMVISTRFQPNKDGHMEVTTEIKDRQKDKTDWIQEIAQPSDPFYPFAGVGTTLFPSQDTHHIELSRYFSNTEEDPLELVRVKNESSSPKETSPSSSQQLQNYRLQLLAWPLIKNESYTTVVAHAHTEVHKKYYLSLGFQVVYSEFNEEWQTQVYKMEAHREVFLQNINRKIKK